MEKKGVKSEGKKKKGKPREKNPPSLDSFKSAPPPPASHAISHATRRQRPVETADTVHVLAVIGLLVLAQAMGAVVAGDLCVFGGLEVGEAHDALHNGLTAVVGVVEGLGWVDGLLGGQLGGGSGGEAVLLVAAGLGPAHGAALGRSRLGVGVGVGFGVATVVVQVIYAGAAVSAVGGLVGIAIAATASPSTSSSRRAIRVVAAGRTAAVLIASVAAIVVCMEWMNVVS